MAWRKIDPIAPRLTRDIGRRLAAAVDDTTAAAAIYAKRNHGWKNVTGTAEGSIRFEPAKVLGNRVSGSFGSYDVSYFIWLEIGHQVLSTRGFERSGHPETSFGKFVSGDHTLRRAADVEFPKIGARVAERLAR